MAKTRKVSWMTPSTWDARFREALTVLCGEAPPEAAVVAWLAPNSESMELQNWAAEKARMPWAQGLVVIDAARLLADTPAEGAEHAPAPRSTASAEETRAQAFRDAADWFTVNDPEGERFYPGHCLRQMADGTIDPPLGAQA